MKGNRPLSASPLSLKAGTRLTGCVLEVDKGRDALLAFGNFKAYARLPVAVTRGQTVRIEVRKGDAGLRMVMLPPSGKPLPTTTQMQASPQTQASSPQAQFNPQMQPALQTSAQVADTPTLAATATQPAPAEAQDKPTVDAQTVKSSSVPQIKTQGEAPLNQVIQASEKQAYRPEARQPITHKSLPQVKTGPASPSPEPSSGKLEIRLFEPVPNRLSLNAHARQLQPGDPLEGRITGFSKEGRMLVDFGKFKAFAKIDVPVREGQILPLTVEKTDQGITLSLRGGDVRETVSLPRQLAQAPSPSAAPQQTAPQATGDQAVRSDVEKTQTNPAPPLKGQGEYRTPVSQQVQTPPVSTAGDAPPLTAPEIARLGEQIRKLLDPPDVSQRPAAPTLPPTAQEALTHLKALLQPAAPNGETVDLMAKIRSFVEHSGFYFEKRLETVIRTLQDRPTPLPPAELAQQPAVRELIATDLKPNLMVLKHFLESQHLDQHSEERHLLETLKHAVQRSLTNIEQQQQGATEKPVDSDVFQTFSHLLVIADHQKEARLKVYYAKKGRRGEEGKTPRVALLLEMDRLGMVRTDLWMVGKDLNITFFVESEQSKTAIDAEQAEIKTALKKSFNTIAVNTIVNKRKIEQFDETDISPVTNRLLDLTI